MAGSSWVLAVLPFISLSLSFAVEAAPIARVVESSSVLTIAYGQPVQNVYVKALIPNLSYEKNISVVFEADHSQHKVVARYVGPAEDGYEVWEAYANIDANSHVFHVEYDEADSVDSERSSYFLKEGGGPVLYENHSILGLYLPRVTSDGQASFHVALKNLAYDKRVVVHYSKDGWLTSYTKLLNFQPNFSVGQGSISLPTAEGYEIWSGSMPVEPGTRQLSYFFSYQAAGQRFLDNNFGQNYQLDVR